ncbi:peroxidase family protein [Micromonospora sp. WMMD710]|uniref:peroxidase family protein n=1 Tax=Micromonospora sp. WMMD710 TaxID=3016085 RepID=UPI00241616B5|nr:peroxidase family protein [Micromonospora sp. WMMD710]MDG4758516.1 peroxidase family protein [Micromonospora sp. WMMD710]
MRVVASGRRGRARSTRAAQAAVVALVVAAGVGLSGPAQAGATRSDRILGLWEVQSIDGSGNNRANPSWGKIDTIYPRVGPAWYADGISEIVDLPPERYVSNRIFNDADVNLYSPNAVSQWGFVWGQFVDHTIAQRLGRRLVSPPGETRNIPFDNNDPMESFRNDIGIVPFDRSRPADDTGVTTPREQINTVSSYLDAATVYSNSNERLDWMREGAVDGDVRNNKATLLMPGGYLPRRDTRGDAATAPNMVAGGQLFNTPEKAAVAGDQRANENPALLAIQTLFAREHNRIVAQLPTWLSEQDRFEIARAVVIAEQQHITYTQFLPALGVDLPRYTGYKRTVDVSVSNEFATVGYRAHSQIRGDFRLEVEAGRYDQQTLDRLRELDVEVTTEGDTVRLMIPLGEDAFFNPDLLELLELGPMLHGVGLRPQTRNDEMISNMLRSFPFFVPVPGNPTCADDPALPPCLPGRNDLGAIDIARSRDHGMPSYNDMRTAYGLPTKSSFAAITRESSESFPADPELTPGAEIDDLDSLDFTALYNAAGQRTTAAADDAVRADRRTPLAARLKAVYGSVDRLDAFVGMMAEPNLPGREFGELQLAIWKKQFTAMRDGDRFYYANDPLLPLIRAAFKIDYRTSLGDIIALNTDIPRSHLAADVFRTPQGQHRTVRVPGGEKLLPGTGTRNLGIGKAGPVKPAAEAGLLPPGLAPSGSASRAPRRGSRRHSRP